MRATEFTPLRSSVRVLKYDPLQRHTDIESKGLFNTGSTTVQIFSSKHHSSWKVKLARIVAVTAALVATGIIILSLKSTKPTTTVLPILPKHDANDMKPNVPSHKGKPVVPIEGAAWSAIAQPLSILDPETLGFLAIDRPPISMPGLIFGELLEKNVALPTNSWCENLFLGASNTEATNRVYQLPYVIDTEVHGNLSTQGVETHPAHVQANEKMVEVSFN